MISPLSSEKREARRVALLSVMTAALPGVPIESVSRINTVSGKTFVLILPNVTFVPSVSESVCFERS